MQLNCVCLYDMCACIHIYAKLFHLLLWNTCYIKIGSLTFFRVFSFFNLSDTILDTYALLDNYQVSAYRAALLDAWDREGIRQLRFPLLTK